MVTQILAAAILFMTCAIGIWKWIARLKSERRRIMDEAKKNLDKAHDGGDESDLLDGWDRINRV